MRNRSRATVVAIILLALSMVNILGLKGSQKGLGVTQGQPSSLYPVIVSLGTEEKVFLATHTSSKVNGNWIELSGGTTVKLPSTSFVYEGPDIVYPIGEITVTIDSDFIPEQVNYPLSTHRVYEAGESVTSKFWGSTDFGGKSVSFMLLRVSSLSDIKDVLDEGFLGMIDTLFDSLVWIQPGIKLDSAGDVTHSFYAPAAGDYILAVAKIDLLNLKFYVYSATIIEVVDYTLAVSAPSSVEKGDDIEVDLELISAPSESYIYGFAMIKESSYSGKIKLSTDGTITGTKLYLNDELMANGDLFTDFYLGTKDQSDLNIDLIEDLLTKTLDPDELAYDYITATNTGSISLPTSSLTPGDYILLVVAWKDFEARIVGLKQTTITIQEPETEPKPKPFVGSANHEPVADAGPNQTVYVGQFVEFIGADSTDPDGTIVSYEWDFGDGAEASGVNVSHRYLESGNYTVTLTVKDNRYGEDTDTCTITVGEHLIPVPPLPPYLDNLNITPAVIEIGDNVTISFDIRNLDSQSIDYGVDIHIENVNVTRIWVELGAYEFKTVSHTITPDTVGVFNVTILGMTGSFTVEPEAEPEPEPEPAEFVVSGLTITREPRDVLSWTFEIAANVTNVGEQEGTHTVAFKLDGLEVDWRTVKLGGGETTIIVYNVMSGVGSFPFEVDGLTGIIEVKAIPGPKFDFSDLRIFYPGVITPEVESGDTITVTVSIDAENVGALEGSHTIELKVDEEVVDSQEVTLEGGASETVLFELTRGEGTYQVEVEGLTGSFTIDLVEEPPFWMKLGPGYVAGILIVIVSAGAIIYTLRRRQVVRAR